MTACSTSETGALTTACSAFCLNSKMTTWTITCRPRDDCVNLDDCLLDLRHDCRDRTTVCSAYETTARTTSSSTFSSISSTTSSSISTTACSTSYPTSESTCSTASSDYELTSSTTARTSACSTAYSTTLTTSWITGCSTPRRLPAIFSITTCSTYGDTGRPPGRLSAPLPGGLPV